MITGMSTACFFKRLLVEETVDVMSSLGVKNAEVFLNTGSEYEEGYNWDLRSKMDDAGITVRSVHPHGVQYEPQLFSPYPKSFPDNVKHFEKVCRAAEILGAKYYIFHGGLFFKPGRRFVIDFDHVCSRLLPLLDIAADHGLKLAYENVHWCWFNTPDFADELLARIDHPALAFNLDIKQAAQSGRSPFEYLKHMDGRLANVHVCDYIDKGSCVVPCMPFSGEMDFPRLKQGLDELSYDGAVILEVYGDNYSSYDELGAIFSRLSGLFA